MSTSEMAAELGLKPCGSNRWNVDGKPSATGGLTPDDVLGLYRVQVLGWTVAQARRGRR